MKTSISLKNIMLPGFAFYQLFTLPSIIRRNRKNFSFCKTCNYNCSLENEYLYIIDKLYEKAINNYKKVLRQNPLCSLAWNNLSLIYYLSEDFTNAIESAKKVIMLDNSTLILKFTYCNLGILYFDKNKTRCAIQYLKKANEIETENIYIDLIAKVLLILTFSHNQKNYT
jgi:tetratricopeptide (TPR) repeat protein